MSKYRHRVSEIVALVGVIGIPLCASASTVADNIFSLTSIVNGVLGRVFILFWAIAFLAFAWGVVKFVAGSENEAELEDRRKFLFWSIVLFIFVTSVWGLVYLLVSSFGITNMSSPGFLTDS